MKTSFTREELLFSEHQEIFKLKGVTVEIFKNNGDVVKSTISNIIGASTTPNLPCGFILHDGQEINFGSIKLINIVH